MPKRGRKRKKTRTHAGDADNALLSAEEAKIPKSLVVRTRQRGFLFVDIPTISHSFCYEDSAGEM